MPHFARGRHSPSAEAALPPCRRTNCRRFAKTGKGGAMASDITLAVGGDAGRMTYDELAQARAISLAAAPIVPRPISRNSTETADFSDPGPAEAVSHETAPMPARDGLEPGPGAEPTPAAEAPEANPLCAVADAAFSRREGTNFLDHCWRRVRRRRAPDASGLGPRPPRPSARRRRQALCEAEWQQSRALARCHRQGRRPGTMAGRFAGTGIPAVKSFPHRAPRSVIGEERRLAIRHGARGATRKFA